MCMYDLLLLIAACTLLAYFIETGVTQYETVHLGIKKNYSYRFLYIIIFTALFCFSGLRTTYNDTGDYLYTFNNFSIEEFQLENFFDSYGGFNLYQFLIKKFICNNVYVYFFITAIVINVLYISFITKHSKNFCASIFLYITGFYMFSMAGLKQAIAIAIALYAIEAYFNKKYLKAVVLLLLSMTFHPYIVCLVSIVLLTRQTWNGKTIFVLAVVVFAFMNLELVFGIFDTIGKDYSGSTLDDYTINPIRVLVEAVPIVISFIYRRIINATNDKWLILGINMQIVSFVFIFLGLFMNPIYLGRMSTYFTMLSAVAIPKMLKVAFPQKGNAIRIGYYIFSFTYFIMDLTKIGSVSLSYDRFNHISILDFVKILVG